MEELTIDPTAADAIETRIAGRLRQLRGERGWSLDDVATRSGVSRATLSRIENGEVSPTTAVLGRLCTAYGVTLSRLMVQVEQGFTPVITHAAQAVWTDPETGFTRRTVSPPAGGLTGEVIECRLPPGTRIAYAAPSRPGIEHHLVMVEGRLDITQNGRRALLGPGDCLRWKAAGESLFVTLPDSAARYLILLV